MTRRSPMLATVLAVSLLVLAAPGASAGGPTAPVVVQTAPVGTTLEIADGDALGTSVGVVWVEVDGDERRYGEGYSLSEGATWVTPSTAIDESQSPRLDHCDDVAQGDLVVGYTKLVEAERAVSFYLAGGLFTYASAGVTYSRPDVVCIPGKRAIGVALRTANGTTRLRLYGRALTFGQVDVSLDLGPANKGSTPAVAAVGDRVYVAWTQGTRLRFKRFRVGAAPDAAMTPLPTVTLEDTTSQSSPRLAADGSRVVLAWERKGSVVARVITDRGASFKARRTLFQGSPSTGKVAFVTNADALGSTLIVSGAVSSEGITVRSGVRRTTNAGASWAKVGPEKTGGFLVGILGGTNADTRLHLVWDERLGDDPQEIRAQYLDLE